MSLVYTGEASGTLTITGAFGEMRLPASRDTRQGERDGDAYEVIGIRASGASSAQMPDKAALESCIAGRMTTEAMADADLVLMAADSCRREVAIGESPVPVTAGVEIAIVDPPAAYVYLTLSFVEPSDVVGGQITIQTLPPPPCLVAKP